MPLRVFAVFLLAAGVALAGPDQPWLDDSSPGIWTGWQDALIALGLVLGINLGGVYIGHRFGMPALVGIIILGLAALKFFGG